MPAKAQPTAAITNESTTAGPAFSAAAMPVSENRPAPMMAPIPSATRFTGPRVLANWCLPLWDSAMMRLTDFVANRLMRSTPPSPRRPKHQRSISRLWLFSQGFLQPAVMPAVSEINHQTDDQPTNEPSPVDPAEFIHHVTIED